MHYFCLILSSGLKQEIEDDNADCCDFNEYVYGFAIKDVIRGAIFIYHSMCSVLIISCFYQSFAVITSLAGEKYKKVVLRARFGRIFTPALGTHGVRLAIQVQIEYACTPLGTDGVRLVIQVQMEYA